MGFWFGIADTIEGEKGKKEELHLRAFHNALLDIFCIKN